LSRRPVSRLGRQLDAVSLVLVVAGALLFFQAFLGMKALRDQRETAFVPGTTEAYAALNRYYRMQRLSWAGIGLGVVGIGVALSAAWHNRKLSNQQPGADPSLRSG
jgi:hypothetical protein